MSLESFEPVPVDVVEVCVLIERLDPLPRSEEYFLGAVLGLGFDELVDVVEDILLYLCSPSVDDGFDFILHPCYRKIGIHIDIFFHGRK